VWARSGAAWEKLDALRSTDDSVTVPIRAFTTAAAGVNFAITSTCTKTPGACTPAATITPTCDPLAGAPLCITKLPMPEAPRGIDEFSTLNLAGRKVLWAMSTDAGPTIARYDLDAPGPLVKYAPYAGTVNGTIEGRGVVQVTANGEAWVGLSGIGNVRFTEASAPTVFDSSGAAGVGSTGPALWRMRRQNVVNSGLVSKTDVRVFFGDSNLSNFAFNYPILPAENLVVVPSGDSSTALVRSVHRGLAKMAVQSGVAANFMKWDAQDGRLGTADDTDTVTYGAAAFQGGIGAIARGAGLELREGIGYRDLFATVAPPGGVRDLFFVGGKLYVIGSRSELYIVTPSTGAFVTVPLPTDEPGMVPWRIRSAGNGTDLLLVTRGELVKKGSFYLLRPTPR
jgi:hypothetical protein